MPLEAAVTQAEPPPAYQAIEPMALRLRRLRLSESAIGMSLEVTEKTDAKAMAWLAWSHPGR